MKRFKTLCGALALASTVALTLTACGGSGTGSGVPQSGGDLVMARADEATSLLPSVPTDNASIWVIEEIYDTLTVPDQSGKSVQPSLATSWSQSSDKLSWTFKLRKNAKFTNGQAVTSADVKFSIEQNQKSDAPFSFIDTVITKIDTPDPATVVFHTKKPWSPLPADMALYANSIVPKDYAGKSASQFAAHPIGSGPFKFASWSKGSSLKIVKNTGYWRKGTPHLDSVTFTTVPDSNTRATQLASNQIQINEYPSNSSIKSLKAQPNLTVSMFPSSEIDYLSMNVRRAPFDDVDVRKAVSQAIDKKAILKAVYYDHGTLAGGFLSPTTWAHDASIKPVPHDVAAAKATLAKSSHPHGFSTTITISSGSQDASSEAQLVQGDLAKIGIKVKIKTLDPSAISTAKHAGNYDMAFGLYTTDIVDPDEIARFAGTYDGGSNTLYSGYKNSKMDTLAATASSSPDQSARKAAYDQMQQIIADNVPYIPLFYVPGIYSYGKVSGFHPAATGNYFLEKVQLTK
ncbi:ABC transporter substrate-binding protein [Actinocatenispora thailandica]|uniref:ABC transporter substrate-binding protein n=1 Tax=Actinocatenispora thailandica TaxID=227318 RepID=A0A7R7HVV7_9ACTN|nr:ABC transporter substrate-binding protein [Actinocatenispora thailandica]BCJ34056.1 ABC transporter substrate-binding protein [Actinocatenispora thailandica]